jgi:hypothetical protein
VKHRFPTRRPAVLLAILLVTAAGLSSQVPEGWQSGMQYQPKPVPDAHTGFTFCRLVYNQVRSEPQGIGWSTDYPFGDLNFMTRLTEFTTTAITRWPSGEPAHAIVEPTDPELFKCPFLFASDAGTAGFSGADAERLGEYLRKGGFFWADDFWGPAALNHFLSQMQRVLPGSEPVVLKPGEHPLFSSFYNVTSIPQIPSIQFWRSSGGQTSERGALSANPTMYGIHDEKGRLVVVMTHNTDIADGWEREGAEFAFFHAFSPYAYALGMNVAVWAMTH